MGFDMYFGAWKGSFEAGHMRRLIGVDQCYYSESNSSKVSLCEPVDTNNTNLSISRENENMGHNKAIMIFIDFLVVRVA